jgi:hypothetical protein
MLLYTELLDHCGWRISELSTLLIAQKWCHEKSHSTFIFIIVNSYFTLPDLYRAVNDSCGKKSKLYMDSQGQEDAFNMEAYWACDENRLSHIETGVEKYAVDNSGLDSFAELWKF